MLNTNRISDIFDIKKRFLRSTHLERDFEDSSAMSGYVLTPPAQEGFERLIQGLRPKSGQRAWRVTGDYGTGKSSFALALAHLLSEDGGGLPQDVRECFDFRSLGVKRPNLLPVLVTGTRAPLGESLRLALARSLESHCGLDQAPELIAKLRALSSRNAELQDGSEDIALLQEAVSYLRHSGKAGGIVIILDELGKFLEFVALHPDRQDIYLLQMLAETASRSGDMPIFVVGLLHQGFHAYAEQLTHTAQKEWDKVAGRFEEILFNQPLEQTAILVAKALNIQTDRLPSGAKTRLKDEMSKAIELGWYGVDAVKQRLLGIAPQIFPFHPTVLPVLVKLFSRFGQNERSLYSFLLSNEPFALQSFAELPAKADSFYRLHNLYDFARAAFGHRLALQTFRGHWNQIESVVESFPQNKPLDLQILKTVAILNVIDSPQHLATEDAIAAAVDTSTDDAGKKVKSAIRVLQRGKSVLYFRGAAGGYCLWPHTSVNLERAYQEASAVVPVPQRIGPHIHEQLEARPLVARRHYIKTGNLRHFDVHFVPTAELQETIARRTNGDGQVLVALCETETERKAALEFATSKAVASRNEVLVAVPRPLRGLAKQVAEVQRWEWVLSSFPELNHDNFAQEEATRQLTAAKQFLRKSLQSFVGLRQFTETLELEWFNRGEATKITTGRALLEQLSSVCDMLFHKAPRIHNELVNRHEPSSAATGARLRLISRLLSQASEPYLGMDIAGKPPEMSMYLSVLKAANLHREGLDGWSAAIPGEDEDEDTCCVRPVLVRMQEMLEESKGRRVKVTDLFSMMKSQPFGVRGGLCPLLLAVFAVIHEQDVAFYDEGSFIKQVTGDDFHRLIKAPENFEIQYCRITGVRKVVFEHLFKVLNPGSEPKTIELLDVVRPLCVFAAQLPDYAKKTKRVSQMAIQVRDALMKAEEPSTLLFQTLPDACGCEQFEADTPPSPEKVKRFVERLRESIDELRTSYPELLERMKEEFQHCFTRSGDFGRVRAELAQSGTRVLTTVKEPRLRAFCMRLADQGLEDDHWIEALGSFLCSKPPSKWVDHDIQKFDEELSRCARQYFRVESTLFGLGGEPAGSQAMRVSITCQDGSEVDQVVHLNESELTKVGKLEEQIRSLFGEDRRLGLVAATRAIMTQLQDTED
jgi:hypothetical protein